MYLVEPQEQACTIKVDGQGGVHKREVAHEKEEYFHHAQIRAPHVLDLSRGCD